MHAIDTYAYARPSCCYLWFDLACFCTYCDALVVFLYGVPIPETHWFANWRFIILTFHPSRHSHDWHLVSLMCKASWNPNKQRVEFRSVWVCCTHLYIYFFKLLQFNVFFRCKPIVAGALDSWHSAGGRPHLRCVLQQQTGNSVAKSSESPV